VERIGRVLRAHGLRGELHVQLFRPRRGKESGPVKAERVVIGGEEHTLAAVRWVSPADVILRLRGLADRTAAEAKEGTYLDIDPEDPPPSLADDADRLYEARAIDAESGRELGLVAAIQDNGAQAVLAIESERGETLVPCVEAFIAGSERGEDGKTIVRIRVIPGLFEDEVEG
jgi:16S rRNA processing protein RimM